MTPHASFLKRLLCALSLFAVVIASFATPPPIVTEKIEWQPLRAQAQRVVQALEMLGQPLTSEQSAAVEKAFASGDPEQGIVALQEALDPLCLVFVDINPEMRVKVADTEARPELDGAGWRNFLVKVHNQAGATSELRANSPNARRLHNSPPDQIADRWMDLAMFGSQPMNRELSGLAVEYRIIQIYSRDAGQREAKLAFDVGQGTQDLGFRNEVDILFHARPAREIALNVKDENGAPTTGTFVIRDAQGRVYPSQAKRLAPDFSFHPQVYRGDGEILELPDGQYTIEFSRGPESIPEIRDVTISSDTTLLAFQVKRWIDPSTDGWWSGDHHIHAAGCAHYTNPTEGVHAPDMMKHCLGEDLKVGANLTWGPSFDYQKQFFTGEVSDVSVYPYLLRYDVEVSGFGSHQSGHLCLLRLKEQIYPGGDSKHHWPTLCLNTLKWAKKQGAVCGPAHSGWGLEVQTAELPNYIVPPFSGIGANEYIVDVTHTVEGPDGKQVPAVDFISTVDTPYVWELNIWYHTLNCGFRTRISGETDFPCIYGERVGLGRSYVKLDGPLNYDDWCEGIRQGRNYVSDGKSHLLDFKVGDQELGVEGSELRIDRPGNVRASARVAARLTDEVDRSLKNRPYTAKPYWEVERARIGNSAKVPVELIVNGYPVARKEIVANGEMQDVDFDVNIDHSSWVAMRVLPSSHTNPIFVLVDDQPIRASRRSAEWCLKGVDQCWSQKKRFIAPNEMDDAERAYAHAREVYRKIVAESTVE